MTALQPSIYQLLPNSQQILLPCTEHVDALPARDLAVQAILLSDAAYDNKLVGRDLAACHARNHRERAVALDVGEEAVVGILQLTHGLVHQVRVEQAGQDGGDGGFAQLTSEREGVLSASFHDVGEGFELLDGDDVVKVCACVGDVRAYCEFVSVSCDRQDRASSRIERVVESVGASDLQWLDTSWPISAMVLL